MNSSNCINLDETKLLNTDREEPEMKGNEEKRVNNLGGIVLVVDMELEVSRQTEIEKEVKEEKELLVTEYAESSISSDVIHPTISGLRRSISSLKPFFSKLLEIPSSRRNIGVGVHDQPLRSSVSDLIASLHTIYGFLTVLLIALMGIKYQGSGTNPFRECPILMMQFLIAISTYVVALIITLRRSNLEHSANKLMVGVTHICGGLACELLLLVLVSPIWLVLINVSVPTLIVMLAFCYKYALHLLHAQGTEEQASEMTDLEASTISPA
ncbi:hypothetical protein K1719_019848 [Acacia pycnantha]|nr:hypothetical protein K1719_019848 [Acacia pycnantha]